MATLLVGCQQREQRPTIEAVEGPTSAEPTVENLQAIVDRRATAVSQGDEQAFLADLDQSNAKLVEREQMVFANLRQFKFRKFRVLTNRAANPVEVEGQPGTWAFSPVIQVPHLTADAAPGGVAPAEAFQYWLTKKDGKVRVAEIVPITIGNVEEIGLDPGVFANAPWNTTPLEVIKVGNVWLAGDNSVPELRKYADAAKSQLGAIEALWGDRARFPGHVLFFTRDKANYRAWFDCREVLGKLANNVDGYEVPLQGVRKNGEVYNGQYAGARIVINLRGIERQGNFNDPERVMRHELVHAVTARGAVVSAGLWLLGAPRWAIEGFARWAETLENPQWQSQRRAFVADGVRAGTFKDAPPNSETFYGDDISFNYDVSASIFDFIDQTSGRDTAVEFYAQAITYEDMEGTKSVDLPALDGVCRDVLGTGSRDFFQQWSNFVRSGG